MLKMKIAPAICMKTNRAATICRPKTRIFLFRLVECTDILCKPPRILQESGAILSRIERGRVRSSFQSAGSRGGGLWMTQNNGNNSCFNHPPALTRRPSLTKEGSLDLNHGGER